MTSAECISHSEDDALIQGAIPIGIGIYVSQLEIFIKIFSGASKSFIYYSVFELTTLEKEWCGHMGRIIRDLFNHAWIIFIIKRMSSPVKFKTLGVNLNPNFNFRLYVKGPAGRVAQGGPNFHKKDPIRQSWLMTRAEVSLSRERVLLITTTWKHSQILSLIWLRWAIC